MRQAQGAAQREEVTFMDQPLWRPSPAAIADSNMAKFRARVARDCSVELPDTDALWRWSVDDIERFWLTLWRFCDVIGETGAVTLKDRGKMPGAQFFPDGRLNYAENMLRFSAAGGESDAIVFWGEDKVKRRISHAELHDRVSRLAQHLRSLGLKPGDRVAGFVPNAPEAVIGALAAAAIGCIWSSCSPDFGVQGVLDRFGQIEPKVLITIDGYRYNGKPIDVRPKLAEITGRLPTLEHVVMAPFLEPAAHPGALARAVPWDDFVAQDPGPIPFAQLPFDHPIYILYSSGTTGVPKAIVHGAGGTLLQHLKELLLHTDLKPEDRLFYFTTCGWMMWNWQVSGLATGATLVVYDGSPFHPDGNRLFDLAQQDRVTVFGTSAKYIDAVKKAALEPARTHDLAALRAILSTGSPLMAESFDFSLLRLKKSLRWACVVPSFTRRQLLRMNRRIYARIHHAAYDESLTPRYGS